jgi:hypothetical protein
MRCSLSASARLKIAEIDNSVKVIDSRSRAATPDVAKHE